MQREKRFCENTEGGARGKVENIVAFRAREKNTKDGKNPPTRQSKATKKKKKSLNTKSGEYEKKPAKRPKRN